jgi:NitT/TauT family transport system substrate-binding protein
MLLAVVVMLGSGVAGSAHSRPAQAAQPTIRIGYYANITHAQAILGFGENIFASELRGVSVQGQVFGAGPDEMNALFAGAIDIGYIGPGPAITGYVKSKGGIVIIAGAATGGAVLVARAGTGIKKIADLAGKKVSIPQLGNTQDIVLRALLKDAGLAPSENGGSVQIIAVANADTLTLFQKGDLDAAYVPEPWGSRLIKEDNASLVLDSSQIYGGAIPVAVVIASSSFVKAHPDLVVRFLRVHTLLTRRLVENQTGIRPILNAQIKALTGKALSDDVLKTSLARTGFTTHIYDADLARFATFSVSAGYLKKGASIAGLVDRWPQAHLLDKSIK